MLSQQQLRTSSGLHTSCSSQAASAVRLCSTKHAGPGSQRRQAGSSLHASAKNRRGQTACPVVQHGFRGRSALCQAGVKAPSVFLFGLGRRKAEEEYGEVDSDALTVCKLTVGMFGDIKRFQRLLERMADGYEDDDEDSLHAIMEDTLTMLLRNIEYVGYGSTAGKLYYDLGDAESKFNTVVMEERSKFREETYVNVDGRRRRRVASELGNAAANGLDEWLAVTLVIASERGFKLPKIQSVQDLKKALTLLAGISVDDLIAFELLWTPQADGDSYSRDELLLDYPNLGQVM